MRALCPRGFTNLRLVGAPAGCAVPCIFLRARTRNYGAQQVRASSCRASSCPVGAQHHRRLSIVRRTMQVGARKAHARRCTASQIEDLCVLRPMHNYGGSSTGGPEHTQTEGLCGYHKSLVPSQTFGLCASLYKPNRVLCPHI